MVKRQEGLTSIYNHFNNPNDFDAEILILRELQVEMDNSVVNSYGWNDIDLNHCFRATKQGLRFTISNTARYEILKRLLMLNHKRYEEEIRQGLHDKKKAISGKCSRGVKATDNDHLTLF